MNPELRLRVGVILRPDQQDFQGTAVTVDIAKSLGVPELRLVVNKAAWKMKHGTVMALVEALREAVEG